MWVPQSLRERLVDNSAENTFIKHRIVDSGA